MDEEDTVPLTDVATLAEPVRLQLLLNAVRDYAIYLLDRNGYVSSWNTGAERFKGYKAAEIIGQHFSRFYTDQDREAGLPARALRIAAEEGTRAFEQELRRDRGLAGARIALEQEDAAACQAPREDGVEPFDADGGLGRSFGHSSSLMSPAGR
jgi:PAS domain S-box-containing protein